MKMDLDDISVGRDRPEVIRLFTKDELSPEEKIIFAHHLLITIRQGNTNGKGFRRMVLIPMFMRRTRKY